ncbi:MAG TPA: metallophosphoesterase [Candidatus Dormibacteraeota bacterium]|nr:metallophosphoesterase [Candidatus Dormibacteraeota bacterium]
MQKGTLILRRHFIRSLALLTLLGILVCRAADRAQGDLFFLVFADPQFGMYTGDQGFEQETANFEFVIAAANRLRPAFVVVCGDLINKPGDAAESAEYKRIAAKLDTRIPIYNVAGNHDVGNLPTAASLAKYREQFGPDYYTFRSGEIEGLVLNSSVIANPREVPEESRRQELWLKGELEKTKKLGIRHLFVFQHHPWFLEYPNEADQYFNVPAQIRRRYLELLRNYGVSHVFAGHFHQNASGKDGPLEMVTTGPVGKPLGDARSGFSVVVVRKTKVEYRYYDFGSLPNKIELQREGE